MDHSLKHSESDILSLVVQGHFISHAFGRIKKTQERKILLLEPVESAPSLSSARTFYLDATFVKFLATCNQLLYLNQAAIDG